MCVCVVVVVVVVVVVGLRFGLRPKKELTSVFSARYPPRPKKEWNFNIENADEFSSWVGVTTDTRPMKETAMVPSVNILSALQRTGLWLICNTAEQL
jgi:hypothetical protein